MKLPRPLPLAFALATLFGGSAQAQNLVQMYEAARGYDATYQAAKAQYEASLAKADQATAGILPTVGIGAGYSGTQFENKTGNATFDNSFRTETANIAASQPLYRPANLATYEQGRKQVDVAKAQLAAVEQDLILRVSQAYFDVLAAQDNLFLVREQKKAVAEQFAAAKRNFEVGTATITDSREAESQYDLILAEEISADNEVRVRRLALELLVGRPANELKPLARPVALPALVPAEPEPWVQIALGNNPTVQQSRLALEIAKLGTQKAWRRVSWRTTAQRRIWQPGILRTGDGCIARGGMRRRRPAPSSIWRWSGCEPAWLRFSEERPPERRARPFRAYSPPRRTAPGSARAPPRLRPGPAVKKKDPDPTKIRPSDLAASFLGSKIPQPD